MVNPLVKSLSQSKIEVCLEKMGPDIWQIDFSTSERLLDVCPRSQSWLTYIIFLGYNFILNG